MIYLKNSEFVELQTDVRWLKKEFESITPKINDMHDTFMHGEHKIENNGQCIKVLNKEVFGNGKKGLKEMVVELREEVRVRFAIYTGAAAVLAAVGSTLLGRIL